MLFAADSNYTIFDKNYLNSLFYERIIYFIDQIQERRKKQREVEQMPRIVSRCNICSLFFNSKRELRGHKDKDHRITDSKMRMSAVMAEITARHKIKSPY